VSAAVLYWVSVEAAVESERLDSVPVRATVEAADKDAAAARAEAAYRRLYPRVGKLRTTVTRVRVQPLAPNGPAPDQA
jgi:hypothetical protein